jgi:hypothetical protein
MTYSAEIYIFEYIAFFEFIARLEGMNNQHHNPTPADRRAALASPLRLELVGLFNGPTPLSIADMAKRTARPATSLYHHIHVLAQAGIVEAVGTRPKGKRFETLYQLTETRLELDPDEHDPRSTEQLLRTLGAAFRMAERDFAAAIEGSDAVTEGDQRNTVGMRMHMRVGCGDLAELNHRLESLMDWLLSNADTSESPGPDDQLLSLTLALAPLRGRRVDTDPEPGAST